MAEFSHHTGLSNCKCASCALINCGAINANWDGWSRVWLAGEGRVAVMRLTRREPVLYAGPRLRWEGTPDWFRVLGQALDFDGDVGDDDAPA
jgi:hypothetical protein